jgi:hypothetical protein
VRLYRESILPLKLAIDMGYARRHSVRGDLVLLARTAVLPLVRAWRRVQAVWHDGSPRHAAMIASAAVLVTAVAVLAALLAAETSSPL